MSDKRRKTHSLLLRGAGKPISLELFASGEWPQENGGENLFRARIDGVWHCPCGQYSFLTLAAVGELVAALLNGGDAPADAPAPYLPRKADVFVCLDDEPRTRGVVQAPPYQKRDGRWYVQIWLYGRGVVECCCNDVILRRVR